MKYLTLLILQSLQLFLVSVADSSRFKSIFTKLY